MGATSFDVHRAGPSHQPLMAGPALDVPRAESARHHVRALNTQFARSFPSICIISFSLPFITCCYCSCVVLIWPHRNFGRRTILFLNNARKPLHLICHCWHFCQDLCFDCPMTAQNCFSKLVNGIETLNPRSTSIRREITFRM